MDLYRFYFGPMSRNHYTVKRKAKMFIKHVQGTVIHVRVKTRPGNTNEEVETVQSIMYRLADSIDLPPLDLGDDLPITAEVHKILDRCEVLAHKYRDFMRGSSRKINALRRMYDKDEYDVYVSKISPPADESSDEEPFVCFDPDAITDTEDDVSEKGHPSAAKPNPSCPEKSTKEDMDEYPKAMGTDLLIIGSNGTVIQRKDYEALLPKGANGGTRFLCDIIFGDEVLATHSLTGAQSRFFKGRDHPVTEKLDPLKVEDITKFIATTFKVSQQMVRSVITLKCADSAKNLRRRLARAHIS